MRERKVALILVAALLLAAAALPVAAAEPVYRIGDHIFGTVLQTPHPYPGGRLGKPDVVWTDHFEYPGAKYIIFEFKSLDLAPGDWVEVRDPQGKQVHRYEGKGLLAEGGAFISKMVLGPEALIYLYSQNPKPGRYGYRVERVTRGYSDAELRAVNGAVPAPTSICGADNKRDAACYEATYPDAYNTGKAVARIVMDGSALCTGWLVSCENHLITNNHCTWDDSDFDTQAELNRMEFQFMYEDATCGGGSPTVEYSFQGGTWLENHHNLDYTLIQAPAGENPAATYGWVLWDIRVPAIDELMYIVGHPSGRPKEFSFESTEPEDPTGFAEVYSITEPPCVGGTHEELGYFADTEGGNSGSPVISRTNNRAIGLHHCGGCPNTGMRIVDVYNQIQLAAPFLPSCTTNSDVGSVELDAAVYNCADAVGIRVSDGSLTGTGSTTVTIWSTTEPAPMTVTLTETPAGSGSFLGSTTTTSAPPPSNGLLSVTSGDTITVQYIDADDGQGGTNIPRTDTAAVDCVPPVITNVHAVLTTSGVDVLWDTDKPADSSVLYGLATPPGTGPVSDPAFVTSHVIHLTGLLECTPYFYSVSSTDAAGNTAIADNSGAYYTFTTGVNTQVTYTSTDVPKAVPDSTPAGVDSTITVADNEIVEKVTVTLSITHTWDSDLDIYLVGPDNTTVELSTDNGSSGDNYTNTTFDDSAAASITTGTAPFTGTFKPEAPLSAFDGKLSAGTWKLHVVDDAAGDTGTVTAWSMQITYPVQACGPSLAYDSRTYADVCSGSGSGSGDGAVDPGETITISVTLKNNGTEGVTGITGTLSSATPGVTVTGAMASFPDIAPDAVGTSIAPHFTAVVDPSLACGTELAFDIVMTGNEGSWTGSFTIPTGTPGITSSTYVSADVPKSIPDSNAAGVTSVIDVADAGTVSDVNVTLSITHTWDSDLDIFLIGPDGTQVELSTDNGSSGNDYTNTTFDDAAATPITSGTAPFTGTFRPETPLSALNGIPATGTWTLKVADDAAGDTGTITAWSITLERTTPPTCNPCTPACTVTCTATADATTGNAPLTVNFTGNATTVGCATPPAYSWAFGDGGTSTAQNPAYTYAAAGTYTWTLDVSADGVHCTQNGTVEVLPPCSLTCTASATPSSGSVPLVVQFASTVTGVNCVGTATYDWQFGDGGSAADANPLHTYAAGGTYTWVLTVTLGGQICTQTGTVNVSSYDLLFFDDIGRSKLCVNSAAGTFIYTVLRGYGLGSYSGTGVVSRLNGVLYLVTPATSPVYLNLKYMERYKKATANFSHRPLRVQSQLVDSNTTNNPGTCN